MTDPLPRVRHPVRHVRHRVAGTPEAGGNLQLMKIKNSHRAAVGPGLEGRQAPRRGPGQLLRPSGPTDPSQDPAPVVEEVPTRDRGRRRQHHPHLRGAHQPPDAGGHAGVVPARRSPSTPRCRCWRAPGRSRHHRAHHGRAGHHEHTGGTSIPDDIDARLELLGRAVAQQNRSPGWPSLRGLLRPLQSPTSIKTEPLYGTWAGLHQPAHQRPVGTPRDGVVDAGVTVVVVAGVL